eukprot:729635-Karenia_brevis.AAC.1
MEDVEMVAPGMTPATPQLPPTEAILQTNKELRDLKVIHQDLVGKFGEDHQATLAIKEKVDYMESKVTLVKTLSNHQQVTQTRIQALKYLDTLRTNKTSWEKKFDGQIQTLQTQLESLQKQKEDKMEEIELDIQTWTTKELALQAQLAKLDTSSLSDLSSSPNPASQPSLSGL